jgi:hypothetical protein
MVVGDSSAEQSAEQIAHSMAANRKALRPDHLPQASSPIRYITENGFSIIRLSDIHPSVINTPRECRFLVQREDEKECEIKVAFEEEVVDRLRIRRRFPLSATSLFWLVCAESCLATYLWEQDNYPPDGRLVIGYLPPDELMLGLHWRE